MDTLKISFLKRYPHWHELWKQEKCSSLAPPRGILCKTQWAWQDVKLHRLMTFFTSKHVDKYSAEKIWSIKDKEIKVSLLIPIWIIKPSGNEDYDNSRIKTVLPSFLKDTYLSFQIKVFKNEWNEQKVSWLCFSLLRKKNLVYLRLY